MESRPLRGQFMDLESQEKSSRKGRAGEYNKTAVPPGGKDALGRIKTKPFSIDL